MTKRFRIGLMLVFAAFLLVSCTKEIVMSESSPVVNHQVSLSFFKKTMESLDDSSSALSRGASVSRANESTSLADSHGFSELVVALIPVGAEADSGYVVRQDSLDDDFGRVELDVPAGNYHMVAVAAKTNMPFTGHVAIKSYTEVCFPNDKPTDMLYVCKDITISPDKSQQAFDATLARGVSVFELKATEYTPSNFASEDFEISGDCGYVFNPSTGTCKEKATSVRHLAVDGKKYSYKKLHYSVYLFLAGKDASDIKVVAKAKDKNGKVLKELTFTDVHLEIGKITRYEGAVYSSDNSASFTVDTPAWEESEYSKNF